MAGGVCHGEDLGYPAHDDRLLRIIELDLGGEPWLQGRRQPGGYIHLDLELTHVREGQKGLTWLHRVPLVHVLAHDIAIKGRDAAHVLELGVDLFELGLGRHQGPSGLLDLGPVLVQRGVPLHARGLVVPEEGHRHHLAHHVAALRGRVPALPMILDLRVPVGSLGVADLGDGRRPLGPHLAVVDYREHRPLLEEIPLGSGDELDGTRHLSGERDLLGRHHRAADGGVAAHRAPLHQDPGRARGGGGRNDLGTGRRTPAPGGLGQKRRGLLGPGRD